LLKWHGGGIPKSWAAQHNTVTTTTPIVAAYFPEWGIYGRDVQIADVPADRLTHLIYAFARIGTDGRMAGACSTSGVPYKVPGRVGDSPIVGHGLYVDPAAGAATATGTGELISSACGAFLAVECMRRGASPLDAAHEAVARIAAVRTIEPHHQAVIVAVARTVGWVSQWKEMVEDPSQRIGRPRQIYTGPSQRDYTDVTNRG
jgi:hypothetical protein